jgi:glycosyltransferase involved in cell wall biosynthesis
MARKKVLIASGIGPLAEVIGDAGLTFPAGDASALARCIEQVLQSDELAEHVAERAFQRANLLFTTEQMVDEHRQLYYRILGTHPHCHLSFVEKES